MLGALMSSCYHGGRLDMALTSISQPHQVIMEREAPMELAAVHTHPAWDVEAQLGAISHRAT